MEFHYRVNTPALLDCSLVSVIHIVDLLFLIAGELRDLAQRGQLVETEAT